MLIQLFSFLRGNRQSRLTIVVFCVLSFLLFSNATLRAQTSEFTYRGTLDHSILADAGYDFQFTLFDAPGGGAKFGSLSRPDIYVNAVWDYSVSLDFGAAAFDGNARYLEIEIRPAGTQNAFTLLTPRAVISSAPYAIRSVSAANSDLATLATNAGQLGGLKPDQFIQNTTSQQASSNFNISGSGSANIFDATQYNIGGSRAMGINGDNTFLGQSTGTTGLSNTFVGRGAGASNHGYFNSFFGAYAGAFNTSGYSNSFFGDGAGQNNTSGTENTLLGFLAEVGSGNLVNATAVGAEAFVTQSNSLVLGGIKGVHNAFGDTNVGIGTTAPAFKLHIVDPANTGLRVQTNAVGGTVASFGGNGNFQIDASGVPGGRLSVKEDGKIGIGIPNPNDKLSVNGTISLSLGSGGATQVCRNSLAQLSTCGSSLRYKSNINSFQSGLSLLNRLRPVSFNWKATNLTDFGLVAEEVEQVEPLLVTHNEKGEVEGVKYDRLGVVLINAVREQQAQIKRQQEQIDALQKLVCSLNASAEFCKHEQE